MPDFEIHRQLLQDCHRLGRLGECEVLLHRNALLPWFILVPRTRARDLLDLESALRDRVMADCSVVSRFVKSSRGCPKVNFASIGNLVPQMHLHIVGRRENDVCWPAPVWGNLDRERAYPGSELRAIIRELEGLGLLAEREPGS